ncbi:MAG: holo-ACP synthase [Candidatus Thiothrix singaporensis]|uniref:Holo-[acyl-carrier-protein] synthase n=1 Tax=Candidatus Thiothrix singaporensis TaxID=2799669 RepID=A0A7L6AQ60_9GAMM|nr:MAG: holo-ACP synthase [Candidatus Thiothrix singaporensis]
MNIIGIGTDIVEIGRIEQMLERHPQRFAERILHPTELEQFLSMNKQAAWLAKRFATKEAVVKALGTGFGKEARWHEIETAHDARGKPWLHLHGVTQGTAAALGVEAMELSVADERRYAVAFVMLLGTGRQAIAP